MWRRSGLGNCVGGPDDPAWTLGFMPNWNNLWGPSRLAFGHTGFGGSFGMADPEARLGIAYVMNRMSDDWSGDPRAEGIMRAVYQCVS